MIETSELDRGRESFRRQAWGDAYAELSAADREASLEPEDLERLAVVAYLVGRDDHCADVWARAYRSFLEGEAFVGAARCAFWLGWALFYNGRAAQSSAWFGRARRLVDDRGLDCVERGLLLVPLALEQLASDAATAHATFREAAKIGERFRDENLLAFGRLGQGEALIRLGRTSDGVALLDEVMVAATSGELSPMVTGTIYCAVLAQWQEIFDLRRAREWTAALNHWCESHPDLVPYRGQCLVHRSEVMLLGGAWTEALDEAEQARELLGRPPAQPAVAMAYYQQGELHRLRGEFDEAEEAYREASHWGRDPQPGLAQLRLAQGAVDAAGAMMRRVLDDARDRLARSKLLPAYIDIALTANDAGAARAAAEELSDIAADHHAPLLRTIADNACGAVLLAEGQARAAVEPLRRARTVWQELGVPYEAGRVRALMGLACRALGDEESAEMELEAACRAFRQLGAAPDLARAETLLRRTAEQAVGGLTAREVEVLRLVASGKTNRAIGDELIISEKTVARHLSNIFTKLGVSSRVAATAYAYDHDLI